MDDPLGSCSTGFGPAPLDLLLLAQDDLSWWDAIAASPALLIAAILVIVLSGLCSMTEAAFLSISTLRAQTLLESEKALESMVGRLRLHFTRPLATIVIVNNIANVAGTAITGFLAKSYFEEVLNLGAGAGTAMGIFAAVLTLLVIVLGEIIPKTYGEHHRLGVAKMTAYPVRILQAILWPVIELVGLAQKPFMGVGSRHVTSEEEISRLTTLGQEQGAIEPKEGEFIQRVFKLNDITAEDIMTPRVEMVALEADQTLDDVAEKLGEITRTRIPLYRESRDEIVAVLDRSDALLELAKDNGHLGVTDDRVSFKPFFVPESMPANRLLVRLQIRTEPIAIVVGDYGETVGVVTLEDVLEELVGEIVDDDDVDAGNGLYRIDQNEVHALGRAEVKDLNELLGIEVPNHRTVAGFLLDAMGRIPEKGDALESHGVTFVIDEVSERAILKVRVRRDEAPAAPAPEADTAA